MVPASSLKLPAPAVVAGLGHPTLNSRLARQLYRPALVSTANRYMTAYNCLLVPSSVNVRQKGAREDAKVEENVRVTAVVRVAVGLFVVG